MLYFAYGSNLSHKQMQKRCPGFKFICKATLHDYLRVFDGVSDLGGGVANVIYNPGSSVCGGLYSITPKHLQALDKYEEYKSGVYDRRELMVEKADGTKVMAIVYLRPHLRDDIPSSEYLAIVEEGFIDCGIDLKELVIP
jgi:gamma-glutamylcyclotransferase (GGCT)/AIG2-like uncharacterized protein YtfP